MMINQYLRFIDGDREKVERDNRAIVALPVARASTASGHGRREGQTSLHVGAQRHHRSKFNLVSFLA